MSDGRQIVVDMDLECLDCGAMGAGGRSQLCMDCAIRSGGTVCAGQRGSARRRRAKKGAESEGE